MKKVRVGKLIVSILVPLAVGIISTALTWEGMKAYREMNKPPLAPAAWVFPIAWTILYIMMGIASYLIIVAEDDSKLKCSAFAIYITQLAMNFAWSLIFFNSKVLLFAFVWLLIMWLLVIIDTFKFYKICKLAAYTMIPYIVWLTFAAYLNLGAYLLNRV